MAGFDAMDIDNGAVLVDVFPTEIERVMSLDREATARGFVTMGVPIGTPEFINGFFSRKLNAIDELHSRILQLRRKQSQLWLLRNCASTCRIMYWMRTMPKSLIGNFLQDFDNMQFRMLEKIVGIEFDLTDKLQAELPLSKSGLVGIRSSVKHSDAAYISGSSSSSSLVSKIIKDEAFTDPILMPTVNDYNNAVNETDRLVVNLEDIK